MINNTCEECWNIIYNEDKITLDCGHSFHKSCFKKAKSVCKHWKCILMHEQLVQLFQIASNS